VVLWDAAAGASARTLGPSIDAPGRPIPAMHHTIFADASERGEEPNRNRGEATAQGCDWQSMRQAACGSAAR
jgi:hypothetical protein